MKNGREKWAFILKLINNSTGTDCTIAKMYDRIKPYFKEKVLENDRVKIKNVRIPYSVYRVAVASFIKDGKILCRKSREHDSNCRQSVFLINKIDLKKAS